MSSLKQLAGQTIWYGLSNIAARFISFLQTPILTYLLTGAGGQLHYGEVSLLYAVIPFANVVFTYGMETAYFRFSSQSEDKDKLFQTSFTSLLLTSIVLGVLLYCCRVPIAQYFDLDGYSDYITFCILIIALDAIAAIPFARLRQENRPRKYAFVKVTGIVINLLLIVFLVGISPKIIAGNPAGAYARWYSQYTQTGFILLANLVQNAVTLLLLSSEWLRFRFKWDADMWQRLLKYALPFVIIGLGGMINETLDRVMLQKLYSGTEDAAKVVTGIYSANYKIAIFITLFIQAFRMAAEPFFFRQSADKNAPALYARVMKWFVITLCIAFLFTVMFLDVLKYMVGKDYRSGLGVVPILLYANIFLGIYYNLAVWYKITDNLRYGIAITLWGALLTLVINYLFIPQYGMYACAWATFACYGSMMVLSYFLGQKKYHVPYQAKKICAYLLLITLLFVVQQVLKGWLSTPLHVLSGAILFGLFFLVLARAERKELQGFPVIGKWIK